MPPGSSQRERLEATHGSSDRARTRRCHALRVAILAEAIFLGLATFAPTHAAAQRAAAPLRVTVTAAETGTPLAGAQVVVIGNRTGGVTDRSGELRLNRLPPGRYVIEARFLGYRSLQFPIELEPGKLTLVEVALEVQPIRVGEVRVEGESGPSAGAMREFYQRRQRGHGHFFTREDIERSRSRSVSDLLRLVPGLRLSCAPRRESCQAGMVSAPSSLSHEMQIENTSMVDESCPVQYYVDGVYQPYADVNLLRLDDIEAMEVYPHGQDAPARFSMRKNSRCGVIVVWMRASLR